MFSHTLLYANEKDCFPGVCRGVFKTNKCFIIIINQWLLILFQQMRSVN